MGFCCFVALSYCLCCWAFAWSLSVLSLVYPTKIKKEKKPIRERIENQKWLLTRQLLSDVDLALCRAKLENTRYGKTYLMLSC